ENGEEDWRPGPTNLPFGPWLALGALEQLLVAPWLAHLVPWRALQLLLGGGELGFDGEVSNRAHPRSVKLFVDPDRLVAPPTLFQPAGGRAAQSCSVGFARIRAAQAVSRSVAGVFRAQSAFADGD